MKKKFKQIFDPDATTMTPWKVSNKRYWMPYGSS